MGILSLSLFRPSLHRPALFAGAPPDLELESSLLSYYSLRRKDLADLLQKAWEHRPMHSLDMLVNLLERRLENIVYRMGFAQSIAGARVLIRHGRVLVNRYPCQNARFLLWPGDVVHCTSRPYNAASITYFPRRPLPSYLQYLNPQTTDRGMMLSLPTPADYPLQLLKNSVGIRRYAIAY